jgi:hypothetical protein
VLYDVDEFEAMREKLEILEGIAIARDQIFRGEYTTQEEMREEFSKWYAELK